MKACKGCGQIKALSDFGKNSRARDGLTYKCKVCHSEAMRSYYLANSEKIKANRKQYVECNKQAVKDSQKRWRVKDADLVRAGKRAWYERNAEKVKQHNRQLIADMVPAYVAGLLRMPRAEMPDSLMRMKQESITVRRLARQLKEAANESSQESR